MNAQEIAYRAAGEIVRLEEELAHVEQAAFIVYDHVAHDVDTLRALILEHLGPVVRAARERKEH